jgi:hypothetical protein
MFPKYTMDVFRKSDCIGLRAFLLLPNLEGDVTAIKAGSCGHLEQLAPKTHLYITREVCAYQERILKTVELK